MDEIYKPAALIGAYKSNTLFIVEDLTDISFKRKDLKKKAKQQNNSWAF